MKLRAVGEAAGLDLIDFDAWRDGYPGKPLGADCFMSMRNFGKKKKGIKTDESSAFSIRAQKKVVERLWDVVSKGDKAASSLATTWRLFYVTLKEWKAEQDERE